MPEEQRIARALCSRSWFLRPQVCGVAVAGPWTRRTVCPRGLRLLRHTRRSMKRY